MIVLKKKNTFLIPHQLIKIKWIKKFWYNDLSIYYITERFASLQGWLRPIYSCTRKASSLNDGSKSRSIWSDRFIEILVFENAFTEIHYFEAFTAWFKLFLLKCTIVVLVIYFRLHTLANLPSVRVRVFVRWMVYNISWAISMYTLATYWTTFALQIIALFQIVAAVENVCHLLTCIIWLAL
jgi:hypothetical protein